MALWRPDLRAVRGRTPGRQSYRMELTATLVALSTLPNGAKLVITTDCRPVLNHALSRVQRRRDADLWQAVDFHARRMTDVRWVWTKGHAGNPFNERADQLARAAAESLRP
ncbi:RNase H family protein [Azospirillum cavernae]|uniref:RNase H family protein n=1 Tax=Azospirillum cavernae TaxID=2320860 RepID=UPI0023682F4A|nr:RNase H family protein [Azospirillum cavernae]